MQRKKTADEIERLLKEMRGGEWAPRYILQPRIIDELIRFIRALRVKVDGDDHPAQVKRYVALLDLHLTKANMERHKNNVAFLQHVVNALQDIQDIVEWYFRNKSSLKEEKEV